jgi:hypothetical protein
MARFRFWSVPLTMSAPFLRQQSSGHEVANLFQQQSAVQGGGIRHSLTSFGRRRSRAGWDSRREEYFRNGTASPQMIGEVR